MRKYYNLIYIVATTLAVVGAVVANILELFPLHVASACLALISAVTHTLLTRSRKPLEIAMKAALLVTFALGIPIANNFIRVLDILHAAFAYLFIALFIINYSVKYIFKR